MDFSDSIPICIATPEFRKGGAEHWIASLCNHFDTTRIRTIAIVVECENCVSPTMREMISPRIKFWFGRRGIETAAEMGCTFLTWGIYGLDRLMEGVSNPIVSVLHGTQKIKWNEDRIGSAIAAKAHLACVNEACLDVYPESVRSRVTVIPNGADVERVLPRMGRQAMRAKLGIADSEKIVGHVGRISPDKGIDKLVAAVELLPKEWRLLLCGPTKHWNEPIDEWQKRLGQRLIVLPEVNHVGDVLSVLDVFALLSPSEAHPLAVTEAWLAGVPTVISNLPWIQAIHLKHDNILSIAVDPDNAASVAHMIDYADESRKGAEVPREIAWREYTSARMAYRWEQYLRKIAGKAA